MWQRQWFYWAFLKSMGNELSGNMGDSQTPALPPRPTPAWSEPASCEFNPRGHCPQVLRRLLGYECPEASAVGWKSLLSTRLSVKEPPEAPMFEPMNSGFPCDGTGMGVELLGSGDGQEEVGHWVTPLRLWSWASLPVNYLILDCWSDGTCQAHASATIFPSCCCDFPHPGGLYPQTVSQKKPLQP